MFDDNVALAALSDETSALFSALEINFAFAFLPVLICEKRLG
jgi:hypothetical protein